jgi:hypothetical protein
MLEEIKEKEEKANKKELIEKKKRERQLERE